MIALPTSTRTRLGALMRMFSNVNDHEALAALRATGRTLKAAGADFHWLADRVEHDPKPRVVYRDREAEPEGATRQTVCAAWGNCAPLKMVSVFDRMVAAGLLNSFEREFVASVTASLRAMGSRFRPSEKQVVIIDRLLEKAHIAGVRP